MKLDWNAETREERRENVRPEMPTDHEIRACFHRIWSNNVGQPGYNKKDWQELQRMLDMRGIRV